MPIESERVASAGCWRYRVHSAGATGVSCRVIRKRVVAVAALSFADLEAETYCALSQFEEGADLAVVLAVVSRSRLIPSRMPLMNCVASYVLKRRAISNASLMTTVLGVSVS